MAAVIGSFKPFFFFFIFRSNKHQQQQKSGRNEIKNTKKKKHISALRGEILMLPTALKHKMPNCKTTHALHKTAYVHTIFY